MNTALPLQARVLVVDDDTMTRFLVTEALEPEGFRIEEAASGLEALAAFQRAVPDLILLDVAMPGMSGFECCAQLRRLPGGAHVPIVVLTGNDDDDSIKQALEAGASDFISKPMQWRLLAHRLRYLLRASSALTELNRIQASLSHAQALARLGNWEYRLADGDGYWSPELLRILGLDADSGPTSFERLLQCLPRRPAPHAARGLHGTACQRHRLQPGTQGAAAGRRRTHRLSPGRGRREGRQVLLMRGTMQDITERKRQEWRIEYLANHDALTDLPNRQLLNDRIGQAIVHARRTHLHLATLMLDLDRFKFVNDSYGHPVGDALLQEVARRLQHAVREGDTVARQGGDEFVILLTDLPDSDTAEDIAKKVLAVFAEPFLLGEHTLHVSTSIGASVFPADGDSGDTLLKTADAALYSAKDKGRNVYQFYNHKMGVLVEERAEIEHALHRRWRRASWNCTTSPRSTLSRENLRHGGAAALAPAGASAWCRRATSFPGRGIGPDRCRSANGCCAGLRAEAHLARRGFARSDDGGQPVGAPVPPARLAAPGARRPWTTAACRPHCLELELTESVLMQDRDLLVRALRTVARDGRHPGDGRLRHRLFQLVATSSASPSTW